MACAVFFASIITTIGFGSGNAGLIPDSGEAKVYGRLAEAKVNGFWSDGLLTGGCGGEVERFDQNFQLEQFNAQSCSEYYLYKSQSGLQASFFALLQIFGSDRTTFKAVTALITAAALAAIIFWMIEEFGMGIAVVTAASILSMRGLILFGDNISQVIGVQLVPLVAMLWAYHRTSKHRARIMFVAVLVKYMFTGYEYLTTGWFLAFAPLVYYAIRDRYTWKKVWHEFKWQVLAVAAATFVSLLVLAIQIAISTSFSDAVAHFTDRILSRTYIETPNNKPFYYTAMQIGTGALFVEYMSTALVSFKTFIISFTEYAIALLVTSVGGWQLYRMTRNRTIPALIALVWWSFAGALSWFLLFKGHSSYHIFIDPIAWHMPFSIVGVPLILYVITRYYRYLRS